MTERTVQCVYFEKPGPANTERTLEVAAQRAGELGLESVVVASTSGQTGLRAVQRFRGLHVVVVTHSTGFKEPNVQELVPENRKAIEEQGGKILTCMHAFGGPNRAVRIKLGTYTLDEIVAYVLRTLGQGFKVCVEIALMAADAGLVRVGEPCLAIGGTGRGADTAVILSPANAQNFLDIKIHEIVCKPY
ncbi:MAG: pyruvate kinase alpha/beta domain-containing protein [bacterium]